MTTVIKTARIYHDHQHSQAHAQVSLDYDGRFPAPQDADDG